jgi:hypothetical protein
MPAASLACPVPLRQCQIRMIFTSRAHFSGKCPGIPQFSQNRVVSISWLRFLHFWWVVPTKSLQYFLTVFRSKKRYLNTISHEEANTGTDRGLFILQTFCRDGSKLNIGSKDYGLFVKQLLKYCLLDIAAFMFGKGSPMEVQPRKNLTAATVQKLVCSTFQCSSNKCVNVTP